MCYKCDFVLFFSHRRNCKGNPNCLVGIGEHTWLGEIDENAFHNIDDPNSERRDMVWTYIRVIRRECRVASGDITREVCGEAFTYDIHDRSKRVWQSLKSLETQAGCFLWNLGGFRLVTPTGGIQWNG